MQCVAILQNLSRSDPSSLRLIMSGKFTVCKLSHSAISNLFKRYLQNVKVVNSPASTYSVCDNGVLTMSNLVIDNCNDNFFHSTIFLQSNNFQLKGMSQIIKAEDFQPVYIHGCEALNLF